MWWYSGRFGGELIHWWTNIFDFWPHSYYQKHIQQLFVKKSFSTSKHVFQPLVPNAVTAHFNDIVLVYNHECQKLLKIAHCLTETVLRPKAIEKVNVKLALSVFHESTVNALKYFGCNNTASCVELFLKFWSIINVSNSSIGRCKREYVRDTVKSPEDWKLDFLLHFAKFTAL